MQRIVKSLQCLFYIPRTYALAVHQFVTRSVPASNPKRIALDFCFMNLSFYLATISPILALIKPDYVRIQGGTVLFNWTVFRNDLDDFLGRT